MNAAADGTTLWYTRCPVATASGLAFQRNAFDAAFEGTGYVVRNIRELGRDQADSHFDHRIPMQVREGGSIPPLWARSNGADTVLVGMTFVADALRFYVRADDPACSFHDLAGRRAAVPHRDYLPVDFMRINAHKAFDSALRAHGMPADALQLTPIPVHDDMHAHINPNYRAGSARGQTSIYDTEIAALLAGEVDCIFAKNAECGRLERLWAGRLRPVHDLLEAEDERLKVNANPRLITVGGTLAREHPQAVVRYLQVLVRIADDAARDPARATADLAAELGVSEADVRACHEPGFTGRLWPAFDGRMRRLLAEQQRFMVTHGYLPSAVDVDAWGEPSWLAEAYAREGLAPPQAA